ncbi:STAS domain-containing protein [Streptomyces sp. NPDC002018]|uniref:STAS domain-containing protein n=1 Tax=Streptomyces sp. NPDC002018 TaxID=3364629 RepID=UPI0036825252
MHPPHSAGQALGIAARQVGDAMVLVVSGDLDLDTVAPLTEAMAESGRRVTGPVVVDLSGVRFADSTAVNVLLQARTELGGRLRVAAPSDFVRRLFAIIGLEQALPVCGTVDEALAPGGTPVRPSDAAPEGIPE